MSNRHRGEVDLEIGGRRYVLRLSLQALAEIESAFAVDGLGALGNRLGGGNLGADDLARLLGALIRGGGERVTDSEIARNIDVRDLPVIVTAIGEVFACSFSGEPTSPEAGIRPER